MHGYAQVYSGVVQVCGHMHLPIQSCRKQVCLVTLAPHTGEMSSEAGSQLTKPHRRVGVVLYSSYG